MIYNIDTIKTSAPSVFTTQPSPKLSNKYTFVPTLDILEKFDREGWKISSVKQVGKSLYSAHQIRLRNEEFPQVGDSLIEAVIKNSHNGLTALNVSAGLHRLVCSNGLTVPTSVFNSISLRHLSLNLDTIKEITETFANSLPAIHCSVKRMEETILTESQAMDMANKAAIIRWDKGSMPSNILGQLLNPMREEDKGMSAWKMFNVIQEKFVRGGTQYQTKSGKVSTNRKLEDFQKINKINTSLWELADSYCQ